MSFVSSNKSFILLSGKNSLHILPADDELGEVVSLNPAKVRPVPEAAKNTTPPEKISLVCSGISADSTYICTTDSEKNVFLYRRDTEKNEEQWSFLEILSIEKRPLKVQFTQKSTHLVVTDKCGDVWICDLSSKEMKLKKILGHCSVILDTCLRKDNTEIFTSDRDEKIRVSSFPDSYNINGYYLGHKEAVISIALVHQDSHLISVDIEGNLKVWKVDNKSSALTFNLFDLLHLRSADTNDSVDYQVRFVRVTEVNQKVYVGTRISNYEQLSVFDFDLESLTVQLVGEVAIGSAAFDFCWINSTVYVVNPDKQEGFGRLTISNDGKLSELSYAAVPNFERILEDVKMFVAFNEITNIPLRKRAGYDGDEKTGCNKLRIIDNSSVSSS